MVTFARDTNPALHAWLLETVAAAGYQFRELREAGGNTARDLMVAVAGGAGIGLWPSGLEPAGELGSIVDRRPLDPPLHGPEPLVAWAADPPRLPEDLIAAIRAIGRALRQRDRPK